MLQSTPFEGGNEGRKSQTQIIVSGRLLCVSMHSSLIPPHNPCESAFELGLAYLVPCAPGASCDSWSDAGVCPPCFTRRLLLPDQLPKVFWPVFEFCSDTQTPIQAQRTQVIVPVLQNQKPECEGAINLPPVGSRWQAS